MTVKIQPVAGYLLVKPQEPEEKTASGIILPVSSTEDQQTGTVLATGGDYLTDSGTKKSSPAKVDDQIIFKEWGKQKYKLASEEYYLVKYDDVVAILK